MLLLATAAVAAAGCGGTAPKDKAQSPGPTSHQQVPAGGGGREMAASDVGTVVAATRSINAACPGIITDKDAPADPAGGTRTLIRVQQLTGPDAIVEYGDMPEAMPMRSYLLWEAGLIRPCGLGREADALRQAAIHA